MNKLSNEKDTLAAATRPVEADREYPTYAKYVIEKEELRSKGQEKKDNAFAHNLPKKMRDKLGIRPGVVHTDANNPYILELDFSRLSL